MLNNIHFRCLQNYNIEPYEKIQPLNPFYKKTGLHIAMFTNNYLPFIGGVPLSIDRMASELRRQGHRVFIFAPEYPTNNYEDHEDTIRCRLLKLKYLKGAPFHYAISDIFSSYIEEIFIKLDVDIVHVHHPYWMGKKGMQMAKKYKIPIVYTYHTKFEKYIGSIPYVNEKIGQRLSDYIVKHFSSNCSYIFAPSESAKEILKNLGIATPIEILPTGIDLSHYNIESQEIEKIRKNFLKTSEILLFCVSRLSKEKNLLFLLEGLKYVKQHTAIKFKCIIAGDGPEKTNLEKYILENKLNSEIYLLGSISPKEINKYYMASDIFIFSSTAETQGMVLLEAMAASLPVVAVSSPGVNDIIQDGINGFKTSNDIKEWGEKLISLMENPNKLQKISLNALETAKRYTIGSIGKKAISIYKQLIRT